MIPKNKIPIPGNLFFFIFEQTSIEILRFLETNSSSNLNREMTFTHLEVVKLVKLYPGSYHLHSRINEVKVNNYKGSSNRKKGQKKQ